MIAITRTLIVTLVLAGLVVLGWHQATTSQHARQIAELETLNREMAERIETKEQLSLIHISEPTRPC